MKKRDKYLLILLIITCCIVCWLTARYYCEIAIPADADLSKEFEILDNCAVIILFLGKIIPIVFFIAKIIFNIVKKNNKNTLKNIFLYLFISYLIFHTMYGISRLTWLFGYMHYYEE